MNEARKHAEKQTRHRHRWDTFDASWCPQDKYRCIGWHDGAWVVRVRECTCGAFQRFEETSGAWENVEQEAQS